MIINSTKNKVAIVLAQKNDWQKIQELNHFVFMNDAVHDDKKAIKFYQANGFTELGLELEMTL